VPTSSLVKFQNEHDVVVTKLSAAEGGLASATFLAGVSAVGKSILFMVYNFFAI
jgi:hypothetical protein